MAVDYFAGQNEGNRNLMNALDSYTREERERPIRALQLKLLNQKVQEGDIALSAAQAKRKALADIMKVYSEEKTPASMTFPTDTTQAPPQVLPNSGTPLYQADTSLIPKINPATNYTPQEQNRRALGVALKSGQSEALGEVGKIMDITNKIDPSQLNIAYEATKKASDIFKMTGDANAANAAYKQYLIENGATEEQAGTVNFKNGGNVVTQDLPGGGKLITVHQGGGQPKIFYEKAPVSKLLNPEEKAQAIEIAHAKREPKEPASKEVNKVYVDKFNGARHVVDLRNPTHKAWLRYYGKQLVPETEAKDMEYENEQAPASKYQVKVIK